MHRRKTIGPAPAPAPITTAGAIRPKGVERKPANPREGAKPVVG